MALLYLYVGIMVLQGTTSLPDVKCAYNGKIPLRWEMPLDQIYPTPGPTEVPEDRKLCYKKISQARPYPPREDGGNNCVFSTNPHENCYSSGDGATMTDTCSNTTRCSMSWHNSKPPTTDFKSTLSFYTQFIKQEIQVGGDVPEGDYVMLKMYLTPSDCELPIDELAAKNLTQWYPEGGYFRIVQEAPGIVLYEGTGTMNAGLPLEYSELIWSF